MMLSIARRGFSYKQTLVDRATRVIESRQNRAIDDLKMMSTALTRQKISNYSDALETSTGLSKGGKKSVINASFEFLRQKATLKEELARAHVGSAIATSTLLAVPLGRNSSFVEGPAIFAPHRIREAIWYNNTNSKSEKGKNLKDPSVIADVGDVPVQDIRDCGVRDEKLMEFVSESVKIVMEQPTLRPLVLGGDHSISLPVVRAIFGKLKGKVDILHFGANLHHENHLAQIKNDGYANQIVQVGVRSITDEGREQAKKNGVKIHEMKFFANDRASLENLTLGDGEDVKGVYVSIDVDCLDPSYAKGETLHESEALSLRDVLNILQNLQGDIVGGDVVQYNPQRDTNYNTTSLVAKLVIELAAKMSK